LNERRVRPRTTRLFHHAVATALLAPLIFLGLPFASAEAGPRVALVTRTVPVPSADKAYVSHLKQRGWDVTLVDDDKVRDRGARAVAGFDLVVISSSVYPRRIEGRLLTAPEPIIVANRQLFRSLHLTGPSAARGLTGLTQKLDIVRPNSPLAANLRGRVTVASRPKQMNYGVPGASADVIATATGSSTRAVIFAYQKGDRLPFGDNAKGRRVGFYMGQRQPAAANIDGWALFDAAAAWATPAAPDPVVGGGVASNTSIAPANGTLLGVNPQKGRTGNRYDSTLAFERQIGRDVAIVHRYHEFSAGLTSGFYWDRKHIEDGRTLMLSWRATDNAGIKKGKPDPYRARKIVAGQFDRQIDAMATAVRDLKAPVMLRFNWEMDQDRGDPQYIGTPSEFISAWRYIHRKFKQRGATNVEWVWAPRARSFAKDVGQKYYPGGDFVDWIGGSAVPINSYTDPRTIFGAWNQWSLNVGKPQMLWVGLRENPNDGQWKAGFINELRSLISGSWVGVKSLVYYNANSPLGNDYSIDTSSRSLQAYRNLACNSHFTKSDKC